MTFARSLPLAASAEPCTLKVKIPAALARSHAPCSVHRKAGRKFTCFLPALFAGLCLMMLTPFARAGLVHPGALSTQADLDRMAAKVAAGAQPWKGSWDILVGNEGFYMGGPQAVPTVFVDSGNGGNTYMNLARDSHRAYQAALRYHGSGNSIYADQAVRIMNAWASTHTAWDGNSNVLLRMGLYGYAFACAGELMRDYPGWAPADFAAFQHYMRTQFYPGNSSWLAGQTNSHYWANWTLANMCSMLAIGVLCDDQAIVDEALNHFYNGVHTGGIENAVVYVHPDGLGQWQESGRDQGHAQIGPQLIGVFCEIAWNQGYDLYGYLNNRVLAGVEYISKYNTGHAVPFAAYANSDYATWPHVYRFYQKDVAGPGGVSRPGWDLIFNHYANRRGIATPYTAKYAAATRPEGGGSNYGGNSGGFDGLGFTTLTHSLDPIESGAVPGTLRPYVQGRQITLSWAGSTYAQSYNVKRSTTSGGPYTTLGKVDGDSLSFVDPGLTAGTTYYYVVSANNPGGESANSAEAAATADAQLFGTAIGTDYSYGHAGATKEILFDGALENFIDVGGSGGGWAGLDLGSGVSAVVTGVRYCPRKGFANAMVGGKFQASNTADFSGGVVDLFTITTAPTEGALTFQAVDSGSACRYVRYIQPTGSGWNTAAEVQFLGTASGQSAPSTPVVHATLVNGLQIDLSLNALSGNPGAEGYRIKRSTTPGGPYVILGDVNTGYGNTTKFSDVETEPGATYYYVVSACNQLGESAASAEISCSTLPTDPQLMLHLKMNGNVADSSGLNFQAGTVGSPEYPGGGYIGSSIDLDGVDDFVTLPSRAVNSDDITIAAWVNWDGGANWQRIFDFGTGTWSYVYLTPSSANGRLHFGIKLGSEQVVESPSALPVGTWTHVAVTLGGDTATLYVNGAPVASNSSVTLNPSDFKPWANYIGKSQWGGDPLFNGRIDDFRVYNHALSAADVAALAAQAPETTPPAIPTEVNATISDGTVHLDWADNGESDFASYTVYRSTTSGSGYRVISSGLTASAYTDSTVANGATYFYVVTAVDTSGGESARSNLVPATPQGAALVHFKLEGNTLDSSGNGNDAVVTGSPAHVAGRIGQAIDLNGSTDYLRIPPGVIGAVDSMTIAAWVNWDGGGNWQRIFDFGDSTSRYMFLTPSSGGGTLRFSINNGKGEQVAETSALAIGTWVHVAVTLSGDTSTLYVNGSPVATKVAAINPLGFDFHPANNYIGKSQFADPLFNGRIDDFRIYGYALTASQVNDVKNGGAPGDDSTPPAAPANLTATADGSGISLDWSDNTEPDLASYTVYRSTTSGGGYASIATDLTTSAYTDNTVTNGTTYYYVVTAVDTAANASANSAEASAATANALALYLKFDESDNEDAVAADSSGRAKHATLINNPTFGAGKFANALTFTATSAQYATLPDGIVSGLTDFTVATWVKVNAFATWQRIFDFGTGTTNNMFLTTQYATGANAAKLRFGIRTATAAEQTVSGTAIALTANTWTHVAVTRSGTTVSLYVNGSLAGSGTITLSPSDLGVTTRNYLGKSQFNDPYLNAALDDFRLYGHAMSPAEIATVISARPSGPASLTATANGSAAVTLSWSAVDGATSYRVKRSATSGGPYATVASDLSATSYDDPDLTAATTYYYVVSAMTATGESADSASASATTAAASGGSPDPAPVEATITLGKLAQTYDGAAKPVGITTTPAGLSTTVTYAGGAAVPAAAGSYTVVATVSNSNYTGSATGTLVIAKASQVLSFPTPADRVVGDAPFSLSASASSGLPVTFTLTSGPATLSGSTVTLTGETGTVSVAVSQSGNANYEAASTVTRSFAVLAAGETTVAGVYLGTFAGGSGTDGFGLLVRADGTATFAGSVAGTSLVADNLTLDSSGSFTAVVKPLGETTTVTLSGQVLEGVVTGTLSRGNRAFSGSRSAAAGEGAYWISHVGTAGGDTLAIVDADGRAYLVTNDGAAASGAFAALDGGGNLVATLSDGATFTLTLANGAGTLTKSGVTTVLSGVPEAQRLYPRLVNASTRGLTTAGENVLITGFVVSGSTSKRVLIRVAGPSLAKFGVTSPLADPRLRLFRGGATLLDNDNWSAADAVDIASTGAFPFANGSRDAAVIAVLNPGPYTVHALPGAASPANADGVVLTELYELRQSDEAPGERRLVNLSTRGRVTTEPLIIGFVIDGPAARRVLVRAAGPALRAHGVTTFLANPRLRLFSGSNAIRENDDWSAGADATKVAAAFEATGAFAFTDGAKDAALLVSLQPGPYTAHVESVDGTAGVALVEVYELR